jgi:stage V sporulation protein G
MTIADDDTIAIHCQCIAITPVHGAGRLLAVADVVVEIAGVTIEINAVRVEQDPAGTAVRLPLDRQGRPLVVLPEEVREALGDTVLAAGIEVGILKERFAVTA